jgi:hypothetical protein
MGDELNGRLITLEQNVFGAAGTGPAAEVGATPKVLDKLLYLASELASADFKPTNQQLEVQKLLEQRVASYRRQLDEIRTIDVPAFNQLLQNRNIPRIITKAPEPGRHR